MAAEINPKENDMQLLIDGYQVQIIFSKIVVEMESNQAIL